jgi:hypothetical protein
MRVCRVSASKTKYSFLGYMAGDRMRPTIRFESVRLLRMGIGQSRIASIIHRTTWIKDILVHPCPSQDPKPGYQCLRAGRHFFHALDRSVTAAIDLWWYDCCVIVPVRTVAMATRHGVIMRDSNPLSLPSLQLHKYTFHSLISSVNITVLGLHAYYSSVVYNDIIYVGVVYLCWEVNVNTWCWCCFIIQLY